MLHRLTLRVLPSLNALVTEASVRKRKRLVMLVPGLVAFGIYRAMKSFLPLEDPFVLLAFSGVLSLVSAAWAYQMGRRIPIGKSFQEDGIRRWAWLIGWVGFAYGVQLSFLVLALLKLFVNYDFLVHPEGPAMMAIIIACSSVTRDAFEIGHIRKVEQEGQTVMTFPDGSALRRWIRMESPTLGRWAGLAAVVGVAGSLALTIGGGVGHSMVTQALVICLMVACLALMAFFAGESQSGNWREKFKGVSWIDSLRFWIWPCFTFAMTYYLVQAGIMMFVVRPEMGSGLVHACIAGTTAALMSGYCLYLGRRKFFESQAQQGIPDNLRSCPFVMGILSKAGVVSNGPSLTTTSSGREQTEKVG